MKKHFCVLVFLFVFAALASAVDIKLPDKVTGETGDFITIKATTTGKVVKWVVVGKGLSLFPTDLLKDTTAAVVVGKVDGTYTVFAYTSDANGPSDPAVCTVVIGTPPPPPPPPPPTPTDPFTKTLQEAYTADGPDEALRLKLVDLYLTAANDTSQDTAITTIGQLHDTVIGARKTLAGTKLAKTIAAITAEHNTTLPRQPTVKLTPVFRDRFKKEFLRTAKALGGVRAAKRGKK